MTPPQAFTGIPSNFDPATSPWKAIKATPGDIGSFRLAGKDVDMFKLWGIVYQAGSGQMVSLSFIPSSSSFHPLDQLLQQNSWNLILPHFDLPEQFPAQQRNGVSIADTLARYYMALLYPSEDAYKRNVEQKKRALAARATGTPQQQLSENRALTGPPQKPSQPVFPPSVT
jgi:SWI/SNF chromatin-remodeling complex subunit SWI1